MKPADDPLVPDGVATMGRPRGERGRFVAAPVEPVPLSSEPTVALYWALRGVLEGFQRAYSFDHRCNELIAIERVLNWLYEWYETDEEGAE